MPVHIFLYVLAYYVEWHLRQGWARCCSRKKHGGRQAPRSDSAGETLGVRPVQEAPASNRGWSSGTEFRGLALGVGQPGPSDLHAQIGKVGGEIEFDLEFTTLRREVGSAMMLRKISSLSLGMSPADSFPKNSGALLAMLLPIPMLPSEGAGLARRSDRRPGAISLRG